jgi:hypothetical protein
MRELDGQWACRECGAVVDGVPPGRTPKVTINAASGRPNVRVLTIDGEEVHRCELRRK